MALYEMRKFVAPEFIFGVGSRHRVGFYAQRFGARRVLIVTDPGVIAAGWLTDVQNDLAECGIAVRDVSTKQSSLEEIFMSLVEGESA